MRLSTNFVTSPDAMVVPAAAFFWCCAALLAGATAWFLSSALRIEAETRLVQSQELELTQMYQSLETKTVQQPSAEQVQALSKAVTTLNALAAFEGLSVSALLARLESQLPDQAYLVRFAYRPELGEAQLLAESRDAEPLTAFLLALEAEPKMADVLLTRQLRLKRRSVEYRRYEVRFKSRP